MSDTFWGRDYYTEDDLADLDLTPDDMQRCGFVDIGLSGHGCRPCWSGSDVEQVIAKCGGGEPC